MTRLAEMNGHATLAGIGYRCEALLSHSRARETEDDAENPPLFARSVTLHCTCNVSGAVYCRDPAVNVEHSDYGAPVLISEQVEHTSPSG